MTDALGAAEWLTCDGVDRRSGTATVAVARVARADAALAGELAVSAASSARATLLYDAGWLRRIATAIPACRASATSRSAARERRRRGVDRASVSPRGREARRSCCAATATTSRSCTHAQSGRPGDCQRRIASRGSQEAIAQGADVAVLDDAFQHRRASQRCRPRARQRGPLDGPTRTAAGRSVARAARGSARARRS